MNIQNPNIVFILSDDQGYWAMGAPDNNEIQTPNLDQLAKEGVQMDNFFCTSPVCSPARASLLTGKMPSQHGVHDWLRPNKAGYYSDFLKDQTTYVDILSENGYTCGLSGKWHLGEAVQPPKSFDHWYVLEHGGGPYYNTPMVRNGRNVKEPEYITELITDDSLSFIEDQSERENPFYLSVHYTAPHSPWIDQHPMEYINLYDDCSFASFPKKEEHEWSTTNYRDHHRENLKGYFASITAMDFHIGRIIGKLEELRIRENTLIVFLSDNGFNFGHHGIWGKGNGTFPQNMYDTSVKVPAIFNHKGHLVENKRVETLVSGYDFMPTLLEYLQMDREDLDDLPGVSFYPELLGRNNPMRKEQVVIYDEYGPVRMVRTKEWKYIHRYPYGPHELYHLINDPNEEKNVVKRSSNQQTIIKLKNMLDEWFILYSDPKIDGAKEGVQGAGQYDLAGGINVYSEWDDSAL
ncbi:sulfatase-like hydrolase/transferase [Gracilibacillus phocaeensis]|uniref:sulfatase-like hydrolase/transferase n=1 Tax=Gracilibacillus phocaeensis TaxID=2042304 RepID=UPI00102FE074|nr:sulfatase-like hydrolase/transferase [Gracilibacillus phocaeensis]